LGFESQQGQEIFLFSTESRLALASTEPPIKWVLGPLLLEIKQQWHEADYLDSSIANVKMAELYRYSPVCLHTIVLNYVIKYRDNFSFIHF
jgi:hypothetical protein